MPKRNQIPRLFSGRPNAKGVVHWYWKPEKRLRLLGHRNKPLGSDQAAAAAEALRLNEALEEQSPAPTAPGPAKMVRFAELVERYLRSEQFAKLASSTKSDYRMRLKELTEWALDGELAIEAIDKRMVKDLKREGLAINADGEVTGKVPALASRMRVLRLLLQWAVDEEECLEHNPAVGVQIPKVEPRRVQVDWPTVLGASLKADESGCPYTGPLLRFGFWLVQRRADLLSLTKFNYREIPNVDERDRAVLGDSKGIVWGFYVSQSKTDMPVACPVPPFLHDEIAKRFEKSSQLFPSELTANKPVSTRTIEKVVRKTMNEVGLKDMQVRDLRRSGMSWMNAMGASEPDIRAVSGHSVPGEQRMMEVYMPRDTRMSCRAVADTLRGMKEQEARQKNA